MILCFLLGKKSADTVVILKKAFKDNAIRGKLNFYKGILVYKQLSYAGKRQTLRPVMSYW